MRILKNVTLIIAIISFAYSNIQCLGKCIVYITDADIDAKIANVYATYRATNKNIARTFKFFINALKYHQDYLKIKIGKDLYDHLLNASNLFSNNTENQINTIVFRAALTAKNSKKGILTLDILKFEKEMTDPKTGLRYKLLLSAP